MDVSISSSASDPGRSTGSDDAGPAPAPSCASDATCSGVVGASSLTRPPHGWTPSQFKPKHIREAASHCREAAGTSASADNRARNVREYTLGEEIANSVTHGVAAVAAVAALVLLIVKGVGSGEPLHLAAALAYGIAMVVEYLMSTLYHAIAVEKAKRVFKVLDHSGIYLFIAGTYTPFCLVTLFDHGGVYLAVFVWAVSLAGIAVEAFWVFRPRWVSAVLYLLLGWSVIGFVPALFSELPLPGFAFLLAGGLCYTVGCVFYVLKKIPYLHSVFHVWVVAASVLQFLAVYLYVV